MIRALLPLALFAATVTARCAPRPPALALPSAAQDMPHIAPVAIAAPRTLEELQQRLREILARDRIPGAAVALVDRDGPIWVGGFGVRDKESGAPVDADTAFRTGSLSKSVLALGVMRLADQGKLDVDRPLEQYLDVAIDNPYSEPVTLAQCMEHTAGFDDIRFNEIFTDDERISVADALALNPRSRHVRWQPGTRHTYSNVGYTVVARAIEVASGEPFDDYMRREILRPIGMTDADFHRTPALEARLATGYMNGDPIPFVPFAHRPSAALLASANDLARLVHVFLRRGGSVVSPAGIARIERTGTLPYPATDAQYGFANYGDVGAPVLARGHDGGMPGFHSSFRYFPSLGVGYAFLINSDYEFQGYAQIRALLFAYLTKGKTFPPPPPPDDTEHPGAGFFTLGNPRSEIFGFFDRLHTGWRVTDLDDHVHVDALDGQHEELVPTADGNYRYANSYGSSVLFSTDEHAEPIMLMGFEYGEAGSEGWARVRLIAVGLALLLLQIAPCWAAAMLLAGWMGGRRLLPASVMAWPAVAGMCFLAMPYLLDHALFSCVIGTVHPLTVTLCGVTLLFAVASAATLIAAIRAFVRADRVQAILLVFPAICGVAFTAVALWLGANGWVGLRTWSW